jgi:prepilin-type N-terminal cleavage/methylation domain-containing protein
VNGKSLGFSLIELLVVLAIMGVCLSVVFASISESQKASAVARSENDMALNLQDVLHIMTSEIRSIGLPPQSYYDLSYLQSPGSPKNLVSHGLLEATPTSIKFEGDIDGDHEVDYISYYLSGSSAPFALNRFGGAIHLDGSLPGGSPQKLSEQVESFELRYFDRSDSGTTNPSETVGVEIHITLRTKMPDPIGAKYRTLSESVRIRPPNL